VKKSTLLLLSLWLLTGITFNTATAQRRAFQFENLTQHDEKLYHFGFSLGVNQMNFALKPIDTFHGLEMNFGANTNEFDTLFSVLPGAENGFHIGIVSNLKLGPQLDLRFVPTLSFGDRQIVYEGVRQNQTLVRRQNIESTFIDFPIHLKYKSIRMVNTRVYVLGGFKYSHDLASAEDRDDAGEEIYARIARNDVYYELGAGIDYYFYYFKFSTEIKASFGLTNLIRPENTVYTNSIDRLNSRILMISFLFE
jgi:hypothetical protein